jgi:hypothetical protein
LEFEEIKEREGGEKKNNHKLSDPVKEIKNNREAKMRRTKWIATLLITFLVGFGLTVHSIRIVHGAYHHMGEIDSDIFLSVYTDKSGTKLDSCTLCHSGGSYISGGKTVNLGSCQWCHYKFGYDSSGEIDDTLNAYGMAYKTAGRNNAAVTAIDSLDSDGDGYSNREEITAIRYPGDPNDTPAKVTAPYKVYTREQLEQLPQHTQFLLMNTTKSGDFYAQYSGVALENLLQDIMLTSGTGIKVFSPDGFSTYHPLYPDPNPSFYHVFGSYPETLFYCDQQADVATNPACGWCNYSAPSVSGRTPGDPILNPDGLKLLLAIKRDGEYLTPGVLNPQNKLDGEGPFRVVPPQKTPSPPDQSSTATDPCKSVIWPYNASADHNAGYSSRTVTMIKVEPLPEGTTDIDTMEAGWDYVDEGKIIVYGAIDPVPTILEKLDELMTVIQEAGKSKFKNSFSQRMFIQKVKALKKQVTRGTYSGALDKLQGTIMQKTDGCISTGAKDGDDWVEDCEIQKQLYWAINEIIILFNIII